MTNASTIKNQANNTANAARSTYDAVKDAANETVANLRNNTEQTVRDTAERLGAEARNMVDNVSTHARDLSSQTLNRIEQQPVQSTLIALAAGFIVGFLARR